MRSVAVRWLELLLIGSVVLSGTFWMTSQLASAQTLPLGAQIVCLVYHGLSPFTPPEPYSLQNVSLCQSTSTPAAIGNLEVIKIVNGGTSTSGDFDIHVATGGSEIAGSPVAGSATGVTFVGLAIGTYKVSETGAALPQYSGAFSGACDSSGDVSLTASATAVCTLTNTFISTSTGPGSSSVSGTLSGTITATSTLIGTVGTSTGGLTGTVGTSSNSLTGTVVSSSTLSGSVGPGNALTGTVVSGSNAGGGGSGGAGGGGAGGGGNGPIVGGGGGGGGPLAVTGTPPGQVLGASTATSPYNATAPGVPNTGAGGNEAVNLLVLIASALCALGSLSLLVVRKV